ncbi:MAG: DNA metabolism protein, partial [Flavobacterium sp.]
MIQLIYDGSYEGWLTAVFEIYEYKFQDVVFAKNEASAALLFSTHHYVMTDEEKANRVLNGLKKRLSPGGYSDFYKAFFSDLEEIEQIMFQFAKHALASSKNIEGDFSNSAVWDLRKATRLTRREAHRMEAFV